MFKKQITGSEASPSLKESMLDYFLDEKFVILIDTNEAQAC